MGSHNLMELGAEKVFPWLVVADEKSEERSITRPEPDLVGIDSKGGLVRVLFSLDTRSQGFCLGIVPSICREDIKKDGGIEGPQGPKDIQQGMNILVVCFRSWRSTPG